MHKDHLIHVAKYFEFSRFDMSRHVVAILPNVKSPVKVS